ncbi:FtsH protease activity modulator HflK [Falsiroseomonas sp. CW058]|uniref:FtsH protease activity modulator HflK n=1 Tax=Falsiroseomonas sp. CW058 TaxID=3388664 RepID=UPI003D320C9E
MKEGNGPMAWNSSGGPSPWGNPRPGGPWGAPQPPSGGGQGGGGGRGPDLDDVIRQAQDAVRRWLPRGAGGKGIALIGLVLVAVWAASGLYRVNPDEQGVVMRFGAFNRTAPPGLRYHVPWPFETVTTPSVTRVNTVQVGYRAPLDTAPGTRPISARDMPEESLMLTGDENIIDIDLVVQWRIRDAAEFLFNTRSPEATVRAAAESVIREVIGRTPIQPALTEARTQIEQAVRSGTQGILDQYGAGVEIQRVNLQDVGPPQQVVDAFRDVQRANADRDRARNEAESYRNDIIPRARGDAQRMVQEAEGFRESQVARARGEAQRFVSVLTAYQAAQDVTLRRMYIETMEEILRRNPKVLVDTGLQGVVPLLNLGDGARVPAAAVPQAMRQSAQPQPQPQPPPPGASFAPVRPQGIPR